MSVRQKIHVVIHIPQEEQEEEDDGFLQFLYVGQVSPRVTQLH